MVTGTRPGADTDRHTALLARVHEFVRERVAPRAEADEARGRFPRDLFDEAATLGLAGFPFDRGEGGGGAPTPVTLGAIEALASGALALGMGLSVHHLATGVVLRHAHPGPREMILPDLLTGRRLAAYSLSEPQSGSDAAALDTRAERDGDAYVLTGTKAWVTHAGAADVYVVLCRTSNDRTRGISAFLVTADTPGLHFPPPERKMGLAASPTGQLVLDGARVPADHLLGEEGEGFPIALRALDGGRLGIAACAVGVAQAALDRAVDHAREREQFGQSISDFQGVQFMLADMAAAVAAARALFHDAATRRDRGESYGQLAAMAKLTATDGAMRVTTDAVQLLGGAGCRADEPVQRWFRETKVLQILEGTNQIQRLVIARGLLDPR
ncbi:acyl-CoA dehydrogenase [Egibacter rhizosphaerae]|uniref:Acyl-CoA dehydrogenase n=1 Tax=Egibacter rhizosphaerae TaxID=1670831 RepID=A0A411YKG9_9ACTN|nr:acyl-CoA dehydrogenase family protein [Egibacter rhizosphaerae]QBI21709.1 acyl-CoA dehydrogenase [Egibacter rhizosphaerae]